MLPSLLSLSLLSVLSFVSAYKELSNSSLSAIPFPAQDFDINNGAIMAPILQVRVAGTPGIEKVRHHFVNYFAQHLPKWELTWENSTQPTILGKEVDFANLIFRRDPPWVKPGHVERLALVAHYDSKMEPDGFIGAIDSAAPCAMMIHAARSIDEALTKKWDEQQKSGKYDHLTAHGIELYFLDGEEAFKSWTHTDSIYGARSLAQTLERSVNPAMSTYRNGLEQISLFLLLDLLGASVPTIPSYFPTTHWAYMHMSNVEKRLRTMRRLKSSPNHSNNRAKGMRKVKEPMFMSDTKKDTHNAYWMGGQIEDDHIPFIQRGVPVLHIIPGAFPSVWHTILDDGQHLDNPTTEDWAVIVAGFSAEWMELEGYMPKQAAQPRSTPKVEDSLEENEWELDNELPQHDEL
ncbi:peptidase M28 [Microthyrium microscopicum]|uniref:Peptide hydrolase n=1 Tax=Microthyrium microscopicum TaxID=703497 RepID=A0A6A6TYF8_9PEZI|nr:peptidase M28 [Microthyrium microscopicum]